MQQRKIDDGFAHFCECEHASHFGCPKAANEEEMLATKCLDHYNTRGEATHHYGDAEATVEVSTVWGVMHLCAQCARTCASDYAKGAKEVTSA